MKAVRLALFLAALSFAYPGLGTSSGFELGQGYNWYSFEAPNDNGLLEKEVQQMMLEKENKLWIVDSTGKEKRTSLSMPMGAWTRLLLSPVESGELKLYVRYPTGSVDLILTGNVENGRVYETWYLSEEMGSYELWYTLDGEKSNSVQLQVEESAVAEEAAPGMARGVGAAPAALSYAAPAASPAPSPSIGFATGGAKDIGNFRENIEEDYLPLPTDIAYEGLFYDYYFDTGQQEECQKLFCPSYSYALSKDPFSGEPQHYLSVGLNSGIQDFQRKKLNLVVVLDYSGSMGSPFDQYYYDRFGNQVELKEEELKKTKMDIADESVVALMDHLEDGDRFGLVVFSDEAFVVEPLTRVDDKDMDKLKERILDIEETFGTNMEAGMEKGTDLYSRYLEANKSEYENRIIFLTDAMPNLGQTRELGLYRILEDNSDQGIYTTFIGIGVDFNTELVEAITKIKGANYYSVHSASEFKERMDDEFDYMVTPLVFDLRLDLDSPGYEIEEVYGSPEADLATGQIMKVNTLFPSKAEEGEVKGGIILIKLKEISPESSMKLKVSYEDRNGVKDSGEASVKIPDVEPDFYQNDGIHKAVLLSRYADLLKDWMLDERRAAETGHKVQPSVTLKSGIVIPVELGEWERQSLPLTVSEPYRKLFGAFGLYFEDERTAIGDANLQQEQVVLGKLSNYSG